MEPPEKMDEETTETETTPSPEKVNEINNVLTNQLKAFEQVRANFQTQQNNRNVTILFEDW